MATKRRRPPVKEKTYPALVIRLTNEQRQRFAQYAAAQGLKLSSWARMVLLRETK